VCARHVLGDHAPYAAQRLAAPLACFGHGRRLTPGHGRVAHVLFCDPPLGPCPCHRLELDAQLLRDPAHERRRAGPAAAIRHGSCRRCRPRRARSGHALSRRPRRLCLGLSPGHGWFRRGGVAADDDQHGAHRHDVAFGDEDARDRARSRRGDLDRRLIRLDLDERVVLRHLLAFRDQPARHLTLREAFAEIRQLELVRHAFAIFVKRMAS
jgi:hypothetical protein